MVNTLVTYGGIEKKEAQDLAHQIVAASPTEVAKFVKTLDPSVAGAIVSLSSDVQSVVEKREQELETWRESLAASSHDEARRNMVAEVKERRSMADIAISKALETGIAVYDIENPATAELANKAVEEFHGFAQSATAEDLMGLAAMGHALPVYQNLVKEQFSRIQELERIVGDHGYVSRLPTQAAVAPAPAPRQGGLPSHLSGITDPDKFAEAASADLMRNIQSIAMARG